MHQSRIKAVEVAERSLEDSFTYELCVTYVRELS